MDAMDCALSSVCFNASGVLMSGLGAPARTATPRPTRAMSVVGSAANLARAAVSFITSTGTTPRSNGPPLRASLISSGGGPKTKGTLMAGGARELRAKFWHRAGHGASRQDIEFGGLQVGNRRLDKCQT